MIRKPLAIDLFCGLFQPKFDLRANAAIKKFVACRAKNPDHVRLRVRNKPPSAVALMRRTVRDLKNACFSARLAGARHIRPSPRKSVKRYVFEISFLFV